MADEKNLNTDNGLNLNDEAKNQHDEINAKLKAATENLENKVSKQQDSSLSSEGKSTSASSSSDNTISEEPSYTTPPSTSSAKTEQFTVPVVEADTQNQNYKYIRSDRTSDSRNTTSAQSENKQTPSTQNESGSAHGKGGITTPPTNSSTPAVFSNSPKPLQLTEQIKQDYSHVNTSKTALGTQTRVGNSRTRNIDPKKRLMAIGASTALVFAGGAYILDASSSDSPSHSDYSYSKGDSSGYSDTASIDFGKTASWDQVGLAVTVPDPKIASATSMTEGTDADQYIVFTVKVTNTSDKTIRASKLKDIVPQAYYGSSQITAKQVTDASNDVTDDSFSTLKAGETQVIRYGFSIPESGLSSVTLDVGKPSGAEQSAVFQGSYKADSYSSNYSYSSQDDDS
ncbi:MAG: hypothetical protein QM632_00900 [Micrococcaceae bacterium]